MKQMNQAKISMIYKWTSLTALLAGAVLAILVKGESFGLQIALGIGLNLQFHFAYQFLAKAPFEMLQVSVRRKPERKNLALKSFRLFSWAVAIAGAIGLVPIIIIGFTNPGALFFVVPMIGVFLGGLSSLVKLSENGKLI